MSKGAAFLLKTKDEGRYTTVAGLRLSQFSINGDTVIKKTRPPSEWRELVSGSGTRAVSISAQGIFLGGEAENAVRRAALSGTVEPYELSFEDGVKLHGDFLVQRLDFAGDFNGERNYSMQLESSGEVAFQ